MSNTKTLTKEPSVASVMPKRPTQRKPRTKVAKAARRTTTKASRNAAPRKALATLEARNELLTKKVKKLELLAKSSHVLNSTLDITKLLNLIMKIVKDALDVETVSILFYDEGRRHMIFELARGKRDKEILGTKIPIGKGVVGWVAKNKRAVIINDLSKDKRFSPDIEKKIGLKVRSIMSIPLKRRRKFVGVMEVVNRRGNVPFTKEDLDILEALGDHIGAATENARLYREAERKRLENSLLYQTSMALGKPLTLDEVLEQMLASLKKLVHYDAAAIFVLDRAGEMLVSHLEKGYAAGKEKHLRLKLDEGVVGWAAQQKIGVIVPDTRKDHRYVNARGRSRSEVVAPMLIRGKVVGLFNLESNRVRAYSRDDLRLLESFAAQAGVSIERARLYEEQQEKQGIERELKVARTVQEFFTPKKTHKLGEYTLVGRNYPSLELSGDYFDVFPLKKPYVAFAIADVAGKGVPASIIVSSFRATLHTSAPYLTSARDISFRANEILLETVRPNDFVTAFVAVMNTDSGEITYCNAGHNPGILMKKNGKHELLETGGPILGVFDNIDLHEGRLDVGDDMLFIYTDGTVDVTNEKDQEFGEQRLLSFVRKNRSLSPAKFCIELRKHVKDYIGQTPQLDDMTFLVLKK